MPSSSAQSPKSPERLTRRQKLVAILGGVGLIGISGYFVFGRKASETLSFEVAKVEHLAHFADEAHCVSRPKSLAETYLAVQHGGRLEALNKGPGDTVQKGEILAVIDKTSNAAGLKSALSGYYLAQKDYGRVSGLLRNGSVTREEYDGAASRLAIKRAYLELAKQQVEDSIVRAPFDGVLSVVVFKVGDKVPDGGRIAAIDDPRGTRTSCRLPADIAAQLPTDAKAVWTIIEDASDKPQWQADVKISVEQPQGGFSGLDREVRIETLLPEAKKTIGKLTDVSLPLPAHQNVARLSSMAVVQRQGGSFILVRDQAGHDYQWAPIKIVKQTSENTIAEGVPSDKEVLLLRDDLTKIDAFVKKHETNSKAQVKRG